MALSVVHDLRESRPAVGPDDVAGLETDVLAGFVLARASAGLADSTIRGDVSNLDQVREWFGRPLWEMQPADADAYFGRVLRDTPIGTRLARAAAVAVYFEFVELRHKVEIHAATGVLAETPIDEMNRPRGGKEARLRIPPARPRCAGLRRMGPEPGLVPQVRPDGPQLRRGEYDNLSWPHLELFWPFDLAPPSTYPPLRCVTSCEDDHEEFRVEGEIESGAIRGYPT